MDKIELTGVLISFSAFLFGIKFPDWDIKLKLKHRNLITHSPIILLVLYKFFKNENGHGFRFFMMGFSVALAIHFVFDLFPKSWWGGALIKNPFSNKSFSAKGSVAVLASSVVICTAVAVNCTENSLEFYYLLFLGLLSILFNVKREKKLMRPLILFCLVYLTIGSLKYQVLFRYFSQKILDFHRMVF